MTNLAALTSRLDAVLARLSQLELDVGVTPADAVAARQLAVLDRIARLEAACGLAAAAAVAAPAPPAAAASPAALPLSAGAALLPEVKEVDRSGSEVQQRLQAELLEFSLTRHKFVRVGGKEARAWDGWAAHEPTCDSPVLSCSAGSMHVPGKGRGGDMRWGRSHSQAAASVSAPASPFPSALSSLPAGASRVLRPPAGV